MYFFKPGITFLGSILISFYAFSQNPVINEIMSSNLETLVDEDGDTPDWIELFNSSAAPVNLQGYALTDDLEKEPWVFPDVSLGAGSHMLVLASGKDRKGPILFWETKIDMGDEWKYVIPNAGTDPAWRNTGFDDSGWTTGKTGMGYGDNDDSTTVQAGTSSIWLRKSFTVSDPAQVESLLLHMDYDDAFVVYINGTEAARANISSAGPPPFNQFANTDHEARLYLNQPLDAFTIPTDLLLIGENVIAVQIHNVGSGSSDMTGIPILSLGMTVDTGGSTSPYVFLANQYLHSNFKITSDGETIYLLDPSLQVIDSIAAPSLTGDISYGRASDNAPEWAYFQEPTPGRPNNSTGYQSFASEVIFSKEGGLYSTGFSLSLESGPGETIYFTTDGSVPDESSTTYTQPIIINSNSVVRARSLGTDVIPGPTITHSFLIGENHVLPVISLSTDPDNFWDYNSGIYVEGPNAEASVPHFGANYWQDWEKPIHIEMYTTEGELAFSEDAGVKIFGGWSRAHAQKSLTIHARKAYGNDRLEYPIFKSKEMTEYKNIVLRNSGNDWGYSMFRDGLMTSLLHESVDRQAFQPSVVYLNGEYWGIHNIREKINEHFIENNHGVPPEELSLLESNSSPIYGSEEEYAQLMNFVQSNNLANSSNYNYVSDRVDIMNFIHYQVGNIYFHNTDWPGNNIKYWKQNIPGGKWRWISFDTDFGFGLYDYNGKVSANTITFALNANGPNWPNPPWSTLLFRKLMGNTGFRELFINTLADEMNSNLRTDNITTKINGIVNEIQPEIQRHTSRWGHSQSFWSVNVADLRRFAQERPGYLRNHMRNYFNIPSTYVIELTVNNASYGNIQINSLRPEVLPWEGTYYSEVPITLVAKSKPGFEFLRWEGDISSVEDSIKISFSQNTSVRAVFGFSDSDVGQIVINEINYNSAEGMDSGDWVELYNRSDRNINIGNWVLRDDDDEHGLTIPGGTILGGDEFLIICQKRDDFTTIYPEIVPMEMDFGLSSDGDCVRLFSETQELADIVCYGNSDPWPESPNGGGATLALKNPYLDNEKAENWYALGNGGNPGEINATVLGIDEEIELPVRLYPNPVLNSAILEFRLNQSEEVSLRIMDLSGKTLEKHDTKFKAGQTSIPLDFSRYKNGIYLIQLSTSGRQHTMRLLVK